MFSMKKIGKSWIVVMLIVLLLNLTACKVDDKAKDSSEEEPSTGEYYSKISLEMPEDVNPVYISKASQGGMYVVTQSEGTADAVWYMDSEEKWEKKYDLKGVLNIDGNFYRMAYVSPDGEIFVSYNKDIDGSDELKIDCSKMEYCFVDASGKKTDVDLKLPALRDKALKELEEHYGVKSDFRNTIYDVRFIDDGIYISDVNGDIFEVNKADCSVKCVFENNELGYIDEFYVYDRTLIMWSEDKRSEDKIYYEGLDSHDNEQSMSDRFLTFFKEAKQLDDNIKMEIDNNMLWTLSGDKLCKFNLEKGDFKKSKVLGYSRYEHLLNLVISDGEVYTLAGSNGEPGNVIHKYVLGEQDIEKNVDVQGNSSNSLKIWALEQGQTFDAAVRYFTDKYPNVNVEIEVGMESEDDGITENDAIKNLNTEILAGNGPDIIYMDGLTYDKYIESGKLYDMSEVINELKESGQYFNNILDSFNQEGEICIVPSSFVLIEKVGTKEDIKASENIVDFVNYIENKKTDHDVIYKDSVPNYIMSAYYKDIQTSVKEGNVDEEQLGEYFDASKKLVRIAGEENPSINALRMYFITNHAANYDGTFDFVISNAASIYMQEGPQRMAEEINGVVELPANDFKNKYLVRDCIAINANSSNKELAKEYVKIAIGEECQSEIMGTAAFQINKEALRKSTIDMYNMMNEGEQSTSTDAIEDDLELIISQIELLEEPMYIDMVLDQMVFDELNRYIQGMVEKDEAISSLIEKVNLYISE